MSISLHVKDFDGGRRSPTLQCNATVVGRLFLGTSLTFVEDGLPTGQKQLCFVGQDCQRIPSILGATYGQQTKRLDLSYNAIRSLEGLEKFPYLEELVLDNNYIDDGVAVPRIETLHTLSLNKNKLTNLEKFLDQISERLPNLRYLSLLGNEACPDQLTASEDDEKDYKRYRLYVLHRVPSLRFLDSSSVRRSEMREARKRGGLSKTVKLATVPAQKLDHMEPDSTSTLASTQKEIASLKTTIFEDLSLPSSCSSIPQSVDENGLSCNHQLDDQLGETTV